MDLSEQSYLERIDFMESAAGDPPDCALVLRAFLVANYERLRRRLARQFGCPDLASECLHEAWLRLREMAVRAPVQSPEAYVYRMACNAAVNRLRAERPWQYEGDAEGAMGAIADPAPGPESIAEARSELDAVARAMQGLPHRHQAVLVALKIDEMTRDEVALRHGLSVRRVDTALRQALDHCAGARGAKVSHTAVSMTSYRFSETAPWTEDNSSSSASSPRRSRR